MTNTYHAAYWSSDPSRLSSSDEEDEDSRDTDLMCYILHIHFTFPQTSKCFLSNGINNMHILVSGSDLQAVRFGYVIIGENGKKASDP